MPKRIHKRTRLQAARRTFFPRDCEADRWPKRADRQISCPRDQPQQNPLRPREPPCRCGGLIRNRSRGAHSRILSPCTNLPQITCQTLPESKFECQAATRRLQKPAVLVRMKSFTPRWRTPARSQTFSAHPRFLRHSRRNDARPDRARGCPHSHLDGRRRLARSGLLFIYPVSFTAVISGRAQRFTENTLYPVVLILDERRYFLETLRFWVTFSQLTSS